MINSKAIKGLPRRTALELEEKEPGFFGRLGQKIAYGFKMYLYYPVDSFFSRTYERVTRSLAFAKHGYMHYDFESAYLYDLMAFKMKRIYAALETGHAWQEPEDMAALKEAIAICERLFNGEYDSKYYKAHDKKWGEMKSLHTPIEFDDKGKPKLYRWDTSRPKANTPAKKKKEIADLRQIWVNEEKDRRADIDRLADILKNHEQKWWD